MDHPEDIRLDELLLTTELRSAIIEAWGLDGLRAGWHVRRDRRRWKTGELWVRRLFVAEFRPALGPGTCLAVVTTVQGVQGFFAIGASGWTEDAGPVPLAAGLVRQLEACLSSLDLWTTDEGLSRDGIGYALLLATHAATTTIQFTNPETPSLRALEAALWALARHVAEAATNDAMREYVERWRR